jgi:hypothetical protein
MNRTKISNSISGIITGCMIAALLCFPQVIRPVQAQEGAPGAANPFKTRQKRLDSCRSSSLNKGLYQPLPLNQQYLPASSFPGAG